MEHWNARFFRRNYSNRCVRSGCNKLLFDQKWIWGNCSFFRQRKFRQRKRAPAWYSRLLQLSISCSSTVSDQYQLKLCGNFLCQGNLKSWHPSFHCFFCGPDNLANPVGLNFSCQLGATYECSVQHSISQWVWYSLAFCLGALLAGAVLMRYYKRREQRPLSVGENQYVPPNQAKSLSLAPPPYFCLEPGSGEGGACKVDTHSIQKTRGRYTTTKNTIIR